MIRIAVCDDEPNIAENIAKRTEHHADCLGINISIKVYYSGREFLDKFHPGDYDVIFMDIDMPELNGDTLSAKLANIDPSLLLVYVTNYCDGEVFTMMKHMPIGFLRKPFFEDEIDEMLRVLQEKIVNMRKTYTLHSGRQLLQVQLKDIMYIESSRNYTFFHITSTQNSDKNNSKKKQEPIKVRKKLDLIEVELEHYGFIRIHASILVNYRWVYSIQKNVVKLDDGKVLPISRSRETEVEQKFMYFSRG